MLISSFSHLWKPPQSRKHHNSFRLQYRSHLALQAHSGRAASLLEHANPQPALGARRPTTRADVLLRRGCDVPHQGARRRGGDQARRWGHEVVAGARSQGVRPHDICAWDWVQTDILRAAAWMPSGLWRRKTGKRRRRSRRRGGCPTTVLLLIMGTRSKTCLRSTSLRWTRCVAYCMRMEVRIPNHQCRAGRGS